MSVKEELNNTMKQAMKARDVLRLSVVRMIISTVKNREIDQKHELGDQEVTEVIATLCKQRRESIRMYQEGNRQDLVDKESAELALMLDFLPKQLDPSEIDELVTQVIAEIGAEGLKDMGRTMKSLTPKIAGRADGKAVSEMVRQKLS
jgi:uncharacterized protein